MKNIDKDKKKIDCSELEKQICTLKGIYSSKIKLDGEKISEVNLLTSLDSIIAVKLVRTAIYVNTGYLITKNTIFKVARTG